jgi:hypothetical protein
MDEARRVIDRLERIERLRAGGGSRVVLLAEVRRLLEEGEAWLAAEPAGTERASEVLERVRSRIDTPVGEVAPMRA